MPPGIYFIFRIATIDLSFQYFMSLQNFMYVFPPLKQISRIQLFFLFNVSWAWKISQPQILVNLTYLLLAANLDSRFRFLAKLVIGKVASHACFSNVLYLPAIVDIVERQSLKLCNGFEPWSRWMLVLALLPLAYHLHSIGYGDDESEAQSQWK